MLRCFIKLEDFDEQLSDLAHKYATELVDPEDRFERDQAEEPPKQE